VGHAATNSYTHYRAYKGTYSEANGHGSETDRAHTNPNKSAHSEARAYTTASTCTNAGI
jgi:hypothetical protein